MPTHRKGYEKGQVVDEGAVGREAGTSRRQIKGVTWRGEYPEVYRKETVVNSCKQL